MTLTNAVKEIKSGRYVTVEFRKKSTGELRVLNGRTKVTKHLKGGEKAYSDADCGLITIFDQQKKGYRSIPINNILKLNGKPVGKA